MNRASFIPIALIGLFAAQGCSKEEASQPTQQGPALPPHLLMAVDSTCVQAPNVITPNGDGINDNFYVFARNVDTVTYRIVNDQGNLVFTGHGTTTYWDGSDTLGSGPYRVIAEAWSISGILLSGSSRLDVLDYAGGNCLEYAGTPICPDQFDPRICGPSYPTNDIFCP